MTIGLASRVQIMSLLCGIKDNWKEFLLEFEWPNSEGLDEGV